MSGETGVARVLDYLIGLVILVTVVMHMPIEHACPPTPGTGLFPAKQDFDPAKALSRALIVLAAAAAPDA
jgi:hypothetical protein